MVQKNFNRFGLRRDFNLSDLPSPTTALNNILNTPSMLGTESSFTVNDLNPIFGISFTNITLGTFSGLNGITVEFTVIDSNGIITDDSETYLPLIKIKTQLDSSFFSAGEPFFFGGDGPDAIYYDSDKIIRDPQELQLFTEYNAGEIVLSNGSLYRSNANAAATTTLTPSNAESFGFNYVRPWNGLQDIYFNDEFDPITGEIVTINDNFWERGQFAYSGKLQASFLSLFGGVNWKGFYKPTNSGEVDFQIRTTGSSIFKFQDKDELSNQLIRYGGIPFLDIFRFRTFQNNPSSLVTTGINGNGTKYSLDQINEILTANDDPTRQLVKVSLPKKQRISHGDTIFLEVSEGQLKSKKYKVLSHRKGILGDSSLGEPDERDLVFFYIEVTEDFNLLNLDATTLTAPQTGSNENFGTTLLTEALPNAPLQGLLATFRYGPYNRRRLKTYLNSVYHKLRIPNTEWKPDNSNPNRVYFTGVNARFYGLHFINADYIYDYRRYAGDIDPVARRWNIVNSAVAEEGETFTFNTTEQGGAWVDLQLDVNYTPRGNSDVNDQFAYYLAAGTQITADFGNVSNPIWDNKGGAVTLTADTARTCRLQVYQTEGGAAGSLTTVDVGPLTAEEGGIYTTEYNPGVVNTDALVFNTGRKYIIKAPQSNALDRTFSFVFRGASGGGFIDTQNITGQTQYTGGYGGFAQGTFTLNRNVWYVLIIGSQGQASQVTPLQDGRGNPGESSGANPQTAYSGGGFTGLFDLEIDSVTTSFTQANSVVIEENPDFGSTDPLANQPDRLIIGGLPVVIAGGGGGASPTYGYYGIQDFFFARGGAGGGAFGNPNGGAGNTSGAGGGGTSTSGGIGPGGGDPGQVLQGGRGGDTGTFNNPGGGGGGGYYGGGGGRQEIESTTEAAVKSQGGGGGSAIIAEGEEQISLDEIANSSRIREGGTTGNFIDGPLGTTDESGTLIFVARHGEETARIKTIRIDHFLSEFDDYAIDWTYYTKDEDIDPSTDNKYWYIYKKDTQQQAYSTFSYKFLYGRDYEFFEIGDFKRFIDNTVQAAGTSRETGIKQLAFGRPQLINKGDQYNILYSLLPIQSVYQPQVNWFNTVKQGTCTLANNSRLLVADNATNFALGNHVVEDTFDSFRNVGTTNAFDKGTRVIELQTTGNQNIILSKSARTNGNNIPYCAIDHRGFVSTCVITSTSNGFLFEGDISEVKVGMNICVQVDSTRNTYLRITKISQISGDNYVELDSSINNVPATRDPATGSAPSPENTVISLENSTYGWIKAHQGGTGLTNTEVITPWENALETRIRWNGVTVFNATFNQNSGIRVDGTGLTDADGNTYFPYLNPEEDLTSAFVARVTRIRRGWNRRWTSSFNVFRFEAGTPLKAVVYNDKGIDIQEPLRQFCTNTICSQNNFTIETGTTKTNYIMVRIKDFYGDDNNRYYEDLDQYWYNSGLGISTTGSYDFDITGANPQRIFGSNDITWTSVGGYVSATGTWSDSPGTTFYQEVPPFGPGGQLGTGIDTDEYNPSISWWADAYTNSVDIRHGYQNGAGPIPLNGIEGSKRIGGNHIYARIAGSQLETALIEQGFTNFPFNDYTPIGTIEGLCRINRKIYYENNGDYGFRGDAVYYLVVRVNDNNMVWGQTEVLQDGSTERYKTLNLQEYDSTLFDIGNWAISNDWNTMLPTGNVTTPNLASGYFISTLNELRQLYEAMNQTTPTDNKNNPANGYVDRMFAITDDITLTPTGSFTATIDGASVSVGDFSMFFDISGGGNAPEKSFARNVVGSETAVEYVLPQGSIVKIISTNGKFVWYANAGQIQHSESLYTYPPRPDDGLGEYWELGPFSANEKIQCAINNYPTKQLNTISDNTVNWLDIDPSTNGNQYRYLHYRSKIYEVLPTPDWASQRFPGLRMINPRSMVAIAIPTLQNATNKLSVYTYSSTPSNRELCCPPLDTSPPFDSSPIGLSTTSLNPDMYIDGLINVRSITAKHPINKFYSTVGLSNSDLPVTDKLELLFGDTKYKLLLGDTDPTTL